MEESTCQVLQNPTPKKLAFLAAYSQCGCVSQAADAARVSRDSHYGWLESDAGYPEAFRQAQREANDFLFRVARKRATKGWLEPVFHEGAICGHKRRYSDNLLMFLMKGAEPEKYRDTNANVNVGVQVMQIPWDQFAMPSQPMEAESRLLEDKATVKEEPDGEGAVSQE